MSVSSYIREDLAFVELDNPPVNALCVGNGFVAQIGHAIDRLEERIDVKAIILISKARFFSAGADIAEFDRDPAGVIDGLQTLNQRLNKCRKLLVMALHGAALGGGLELALSAHLRICAPDTKIGFPEINLGLLPGAGGTQALPRLVGIETAYQIMSQGRPITVEKALQTGLINKISREDLLGDAIKLARHYLEYKQWPLKPCEYQIDKKQAKLIALYRQVIPSVPGEARTASCHAILDCLQQAVDYPFAEGLKFEAEKFHLLLASYPSRALRYGFFAAKAAASLTPDQRAEIGSRMMTAMAQEAEKLIEEGRARRHTDIDAVMTDSHGFAAEAGGPLFWLKEHQT